MISLTNLKSDITSTIKLALPIITGQVGIMLMGFTDTLQVGQMARGGVEALAASADANGIYINVAIIGYICLQIVSPMIAKTLASDRQEETSELLLASCLVASLLSVICGIAIWQIGQHLELLKQPIEIRGITQSFLGYITLSIFPSFIFSAFKSVTDGLSRTKIGMNITLLALILNIALNHVLINGIWIFPEMGLNGAGLSTLLSRIFMAICIIGYTFFQTNIRIQLHSFQQSLSKLVEILRLGIPSGLQGFIEIAAFYGAVVMMGWISVQHKAAHQVAINLVALTYMASTGIAAAGGIRVGTAMGEKSREGILRAGTAALVVVISFMAICAMLFISFNEWLASYVNDEAVVLLAAQLIIWGGLFQIFDGIQAVSLGILRGISDVNIPTGITIIAYWIVGLPVSYLLAFPFHLQHIGIWIGLTAGLFVSAILLSWRFYSKVKRLVL